MIMNKILHVSTRHNIGGVSEVILNSLSILKFEQHYATGFCEKNEIENKLLQKEIGYTLHRIHHMRRKINLKSDFFSFLELVKVMKKVKPHIVHTHMSKAGLLGRLAALTLSPRPKIVHSYHGHVLDKYFSRQLNLIFKLVEKLLGKITDVFQCDGNQIKNDILGFKIYPKDYSIAIVPGLIYNISEGHPQKKLNGNFRVLVVTRIEAIKGIDRIFDIASILKYRHKILDIEFLIIGGGALENHYSSLIEAKTLSIKFLGWKENVAQFYSNSHLLLHPSSSEGTPLVVMGAASFALPCVATNVGSMKDLIEHGKSGLLVNPSANELAESIKILYLNESLRISMAINARAKALNEFKIETFLKSQELIYNKLFTTTQ